MLRTMIARLATLALVAGLAVFALPAPSHAARSYEPLGRAYSKDHVLRRGCHDYTYRYTVDPPNNQWSAEVFVVGPGRLGLGSNFLDAATDPKRGKKSLTVCRHSAPYGTYRLKMKVIYSEGRDSTSALVKPTRFRFLAPR